MSGRAAGRKRAAGAAGLTDSSSGGGSGGKGSSRDEPQSERGLRSQKRDQLNGSVAAAVRVPLASAQSAAKAQQQRARDQAAARRKRNARRAATKAAQEAARRRAELKEQAQRDQQNPSAAGLPSHWEPVDPSHGNSTLVLLDPVNKPHHAAELAKVTQNFTATGGAGTIRSVHRVQNAHLHRQYETAKAKMQQSGTSAAASLLVDHVVYHGTRMNPPHLIHTGTKGFDPALGMAMSGSAMVAVRQRMISREPSVHAGYSSSGYAHLVQQAHMPFGGLAASQYYYGPSGYVANFQQIFQARITVPQPPPAGPYSIRSLEQRRDNQRSTRGPGIFVVPRSEQCYPEYLITFQ